MLRTAFYALALTIALAIVANAQTPLQRAVKVARDSILCTASASQRQRRACARLDSIVAAPQPVAAIASTTTAEVVYASERPFFPNPGADTVTVCGMVSSGGRWRIAVPAARLTSGADSAGWGLRTGNPLAIMCAGALVDGRATVADSVAVQWRGEWILVGGRRLWRPFPVVP